MLLEHVVFATGCFAPYTKFSDAQTIQTETMLHCNIYHFNLFEYLLLNSYPNHNEIFALIYALAMVILTCISVYDGTTFESSFIFNFRYAINCAHRAFLQLVISSSC